MSEYPKKLVSPEGGVALVKEAKDEATLKALGYVPADKGWAKDGPKEGDTVTPKSMPPKAKAKVLGSKKVKR